MATFNSKPERRVGFDCELVEPPPEQFLQSECPVCLLILREPHQVTCCGYSYCRSCIEDIKAQSKPCPTCKAEKFSDFVNKGLRRNLYALKAYCTYKKDGCEWTGELGQLDKHLNTDLQPDKQLNGCPFVNIDCIICGSKVKRYDIDNHHLTCSSTPVTCDFYHVGCKVEIPRKDMPEHLRENLNTHLLLLVSSYTKQKDEIAANKLQIAELTAITTTQKEQILHLHAENNELRKLIIAPKIELVPRERVIAVQPSPVVIMENFEQHKREDTVWYSSPHYTHPKGYMIQFAVYPNGDGPGKGTHLSVYTHIMPGEFDDDLTWPIRGEIRYRLISQEDGKNHKTGVSTYHERRSDKSCARVLYAQRSTGLGMGQFLQNNLLKPKYLQNNCLKLQIYGGNVRL